MIHPFTRKNLSINALVSLVEAKPDLTGDIKSAVIAALEDYVLEVVYTSDCYAVCADSELYANIDQGDMIDRVGGFDDCVNADQCVSKESNVVVRMQHELLSERLAEEVEELADAMKNADVGKGNYVDVSTLRIVEGREADFENTDGPVIGTNEPVVYGVYYEVTEDSLPRKLILAADILVEGCA